MRVAARLASLAVALLSCACAESSTAPSGQGSPANVALAGYPSCYPTPATPCSVTLSAEVTDANGRALPAENFSYRWSGCASGTAGQASCSIDRPGDFTAIVDVRDSNGLSLRGTRIVQGVNRPPAPTFTDTISQSASGKEFTLFAYSNDPDLNSLAGNCAGRREVVAVGDCFFSTTMCASSLTGFVIDVYTVKTAPAGMCTATLTITDEWGASGSVTKSFSYPR